MDLLDPLAQAHMLEACQGAREMPMLKVKSEQSCWIEGLFDGFWVAGSRIQAVPPALRRLLRGYARGRMAGDFPTEDRSSLETFMYRQEAEDLGALASKVASSRGWSEDLITM